MTIQNLFGNIPSNIYLADFPSRLHQRFQLIFTLIIKKSKMKTKKYNKNKMKKDFETLVADSETEKFF